MIKRMYIIKLKINWVSLVQPNLVLEEFSNPCD